MADGLPLPLTGFYIDLAVTGEVTGFSYHGKADDLLRPETIADKREALAHFVKHIEAELLFTVLHQSVYVQGMTSPISSMKSCLDAADIGRPEGRECRIRRI